MADPYVIFPGTSDHIATPDVNLLDADSAHLYQSQGKWSPTQVATWVESPDAGVFGGKSYVVSNTAGVGQNRIDTWFQGIATFPVTPGETAQVSAYVENISASAPLRMSIVFAGDANADQAVGWPEGRGWVSGAFIVPPAATSMSIILYYTAPASLEEWWFGGACYNEGPAPLFERSLRVVGDLYEETLPVDMPISFAADGTPLTVGEGWAGNGYSYNRYDGSDSSGLLVASFQAGDVPVAAQLPG